MNNKKGFALLWSYLAIFVLVILLEGFYLMSNNEISRATVSTSELQAFYLAESALDQKVWELANNNTNAIPATSFGGGTYQAAYDAGAGLITATGAYSGVTKTLAATVESSQNLPPGVKASVTVPSTMALFLGMYVDGREYNSGGDLTSDPGTYGMAYGAEPTFDGWILPKVGGNGIAPTQPVPPEVKHMLTQQEIADVQTPEAVLGLPAGSTALNTYKSTSPPSAPLNNQVYYYTPTSPGSVLFPAATINMGASSNPGSGILIVNNTSSNSWVRLQGSFKGLVICNNCKFDQYATVTGAVTSVDPVQGDFVGPLTSDLNRFARLEYSPEALTNLPAIAGASYSQTTINVKNWIDNQNESGRLVN